MSNRSPIKKPPRSIKRLTSLFLYTRAGGRCELDGCNTYLLEHKPTETPGNFAEQAHVYGFKEKAARGSEPDRPAVGEINEVDNLIAWVSALHRLRPRQAGRRLHQDPGDLMKPNDYLNTILQQQTFGREEQEYQDLLRRRDDVTALLESHFSKSQPSIRQAGSMAKTTMIRELYDVDLTCYFDHSEVDAGKTLKEIYESVEKALQASYNVQRKASSLRVRDPDDWSTDLHVDVVPGRFIGDDRTDVNLHRTTPEKQSLKTNLQVHVDHIKGSGVTPAIRLQKLWKARNGLASAKTFVLELLVVKILAKEKALALDEQLKLVWTEFRDNADSLSVEDPANSNNDLTDAVDACRGHLSAAARTTLWQIETQGWEAAFGPVDGEEPVENSANRSDGLKAAAAAVTTACRPYCGGR